MTKRVAIIGLGWIGQPLAKQLANRKIKVIGTTRAKDKQQELRAQKVNAVLLSLAGDNTDFSELSIDEFDTVVIAITPGFKQGATDYANNVEALVSYATIKKVKQLVLLSSTGVYTGLHGLVTEQSELALNVGKVALLHQAEQAVLNFTGASQVLRLAGLVGPDRFPGTFLAGKKDVADPEASVNLIHQQDVLNLIQSFIEQPELVGIYNCVSPTCCTRENFYSRAARALGLTPPSFAKQEDILLTRKVSADKLKETLGYQFVYSDLLVWLSTR